MNIIEDSNFLRSLTNNSVFDELISNEPIDIKTLPINLKNIKKFYNYKLSFSKKNYWNSLTIWII